jgi:4a-hydroxytetrahydrobiopterin dehydratase
VGEEAEKAGHHPDIDIRYNRVRLGLVTHDAGVPSDRSSSLGWEAGGLTTKDFDLATILDKLV